MPSVAQRMIDWTKGYNDTHTWLQRLWTLVTTWPTMLLDIIYDRFDLWSDKVWPTGERRADYAKVRGFLLYATVIWFTIKVGLNSKTITLGFLWFMLCILAASISERVFISAVTAWASVRKATAESSSSAPTGDAPGPVATNAVRKVEFL